MIKKTVQYIKIPKKVFFSILIGAALVIGLKMLKPEFVMVDIGTIEQGLFQKTIVDEAITQFQQKQVITAPGDGITPTLKIKEGDKITKGEILFTFTWDRSIKMRAPFDSYVLKVYEKDKKHVMRGTPIIEVGNSENIEIVAKLLSEEVVDVAIGQRVIVSKWGKPEDLEGKVVKIERAASEEISALGVKEQRVKVFIELLTPREKWQSLGDGFRVEVEIVTEEKENALLLPVGALFSYENKPAIYIVEKKRLKLTPVEVGQKNQDYIHLRTSLPNDTQVVLYPGPNLENGLRVKPRK